MEIEFARRRKTAAVTASRVLKRLESGTVFSNIGAGATVQLTAPADAEDGDTFSLTREAAQAFQFRPQAGQQVVAAIGAGAYGAQAAGQAINQTAAGFITLTKRGAFWIAEYQTDKANFAMVA